MVIFSDPGEEIYSSNTFVTMNGTEVSGIINIPNTAILGSTRLRIVLSETNNSTSISSCGTYSNGETEDYDVVIVGNTGSQPALNVALSTNNSIKYLITNGTGISGTFFVLSESDTLKYDPINYTLYNSTAANLSSVTFDTTLAKVSNGRALLLSTGKNGKLINFTVKGLRSGIRYYLYAYSYTTTSGGNIYNAPVMIDSLTTIVAPNIKSIVTINSSEVNANTAILRWTNGNGSGRIIVVAKKTLSADVPVNDSLYTDNFAFGRGNSIGSSNYVVKTVLNYAPNEKDSLVLTNLESGVKYQVTSYEFNVEERKLPLKNLYRYSANSSKVSFTTLQDYFAVGKALVGNGYTQDFDNMTGASATVLPSGWQSSSSVTVDNGSSSSAGVKNYGLSSSASNRALGILGNAIIGVKIQNAISAATNTPWTSVIVKYTGQQWHNGDNSADSLKVQYSLNAYIKE